MPIETAALFGLHMTQHAICYTVSKVYNKKQLKYFVGAYTWDIENQDRVIRTYLLNATKTLNAIVESISLLVWWQLGDASPDRSDALL